MTDSILAVIAAFVVISIALVAPKSCDVEYATEHPTYISPADQVLIDIKDRDYE